jgi:hypothetical protein
MPSVSEALQRLKSKLALAHQQKRLVLKIIHGYGSKVLGEIFGSQFRSV